ncbi:hypothetical protein [Microbulbifer sp. GL-2]|uniref:hypothetical protein n=1 Tax=Microbulbifer sp. GL-2 TaxID=2591606 RepID=UPI0011631315|nr:hypothetical protein [Microbulbifer sp. GL-2]BBM00451.1 hypothetical protein GL2_05250 [Microbulbifer sp. GL-2]
MDYKSDDKKLEINVNDLASRVLKMSDEDLSKSVDYAELQTVMLAILDLRRQID